MRRSLIAVALGLGLLSASLGIGAASAAGPGLSIPNGSGAGELAATPVHGQRYGYYRHLPPPRPRHPMPAPWHRGYEGHGYRHGHPQAWYDDYRYRGPSRPGWRG